MKNATRQGKYRFYSSSLSRHMVRSVERHLPKIGCPLHVRAISHGANNGWYELIVTGMLGKLVLRGCSWGYYGEGCRATQAVLTMLGVHYWDVERAAFQTPNKTVGEAAGKGQEFFKFHLLPQVPNGTAYSVVNGQVEVAA